MIGQSMVYALGWQHSAKRRVAAAKSHLSGNRQTIDGARRAYRRIRGVLRDYKCIPPILPGRLAVCEGIQTLYRIQFPIPKPTRSLLEMILPQDDSTTAS